MPPVRLRFTDPAEAEEIRWPPEAAGDPLDAGTITATAGDGTVQIAEGTPPSGGSGSYTRDLYRSTSSGQKGSLLASDISLPYDDDTAENDTTYYYTLEVSAGEDTDDTPQVSATPEAASEVEPFFSDDFAGGQKSDANGFQWGGTPLSDDIAHSGTHSMRFDFGPVEPGGGSHWWSEERFSLGRSVSELWVEFYIYFPDGSEGIGHPTMGPSARYRQEWVSGSPNNNKLAYWWGEAYEREPLAGWETWTNDSSGNQAYTNLARTEGNRDGDSVLVRRPSHNPPGTLNGGSGSGICASDADRGRWIQVRMHLKIADIGVSNGEFHLWKDGVLIGRIENDPWWDEGETANHISAGYVMGYDNARFAEYTAVYLDSFKFYDTDPGWEA